MSSSPANAGPYLVFQGPRFHVVKTARGGKSYGTAAVTKEMFLQHANMKQKTVACGEEFSLDESYSIVVANRG